MIVRPRPAAPIAFAALVCLPVAGTGAAERALNVYAAGNGSARAPCRIVLDGVPISAEAVRTFVTRWRGREAHVRGAAETTYRCMGAVVYELQRAGYRIGFISEPAAEAAARR